jgi:hypothetical protein
LLLSIGPASATNAITFTNPSFASAALSPWTEQHLGSAGACTGAQGNIYSAVSSPDNDADGGALSAASDPTENPLRTGCTLWLNDSTVTVGKTGRQRITLWYRRAAPTCASGGDYDELGVQWDGFITTIAIGNTGTPMISDNNWHQATFTTTASISAGTHEVQISSDSYCYNGGSYSGSQTTYIDNIGGTYVETSYGIFMGAW